MGNKLYSSNIKYVLSVTIFGVFIILQLFMNRYVVSASLVSEQFYAAEQINAGLIVSIDASNPDSVVLASLSNREYLFGVVVEPDDSAITFAKTPSTVSVSNSGQTQVYVSDANGDIKKGDFIGASWLEGVGMKSIDEGRQKLLGVAMEDFNTDNAIEYGNIITASGDKNIKIVPINVRLFDKEGVSSDLNTKQGITASLSTLVGKDVSALKAFIGTIVFVISIVIAGLFINSSIRGSFVSIGRNPLAADSIFNGLLHVSGLSVVVILIGSVLAYVVLVV